MENIFEKFLVLEKKSEEFGFVWGNKQQVIEQIRNECREVEEVLLENQGKERLQEEMGDLFHAIASLCYTCNLDPQETFLKSIEKYEKRFNKVVDVAKREGYSTLKGQSLELVLKFWKQAKKS